MPIYVLLPCSAPESTLFRFVFLRRAMPLCADLCALAQAHLIMWSGACAVLGSLAQLFLARSASVVWSLRELLFLAMCYLPFSSRRDPIRSRVRPFRRAAVEAQVTSSITDNAVRGCRFYFALLFGLSILHVFVLHGIVWRAGFGL